MQSLAREQQRMAARRTLRNTFSCNASISMKAVQEFARSRRKYFVGLRGGRVKTALLLLVLFVSGALTIPWGPSPTVQTFGRGLVVARITGVGTLLWTALLFLSMSRTLLKMVYACLPHRSPVARLLDMNHNVHMYCGMMTVAFGSIHMLAHLSSTYIVMATTAHEELNEVLKCATVGDRGTFEYLEWPACPLQASRPYFVTLLCGMPGLTGFALLGLIFLLGYTARLSVRNANFEVFWYVHNVGIAMWFLLLFLHGSQNWFGIGVPLVLPFCTVPLCLYLVDRVRRILKYYLFRGGVVRILSAVVRPGKNGGAHGSLAALQISKPPLFLNFRAGMYAYLNVRECSAWQWHPFTVISGKQDETVDFIVAGIGDWTVALAQHLLDFKQDRRQDFPEIAIDGPYAAPVTTALGSQILIAVGAGVGITPFLALMSRIVAMLDEDGDDGGDQCNGPCLQEAHFFWTTRNAEEFLFGRQHFSRIQSESRLRQKVFLHLHVTKQEAQGDAAAFLFREALRKQSRIDHAAFSETIADLTAEEVVAAGPQVPWCWVHGANLDVMWVTSLMETAEETLQDMEDDDPNVVVRISNGSSIERKNSKESGWESLHGRLANAIVPRLFRLASSATVEEQQEAGESPQPVGDCAEAMVPIVFGRPDFAKEIHAIGRAHPEYDVDVYACGNPELVESLQDICKLCASRSESTTGARSSEQKRRQRFQVHYENFGAE